MINEALDFLAVQVNEYVQRKTGYSNKVKLGKLYGSGGNELSGSDTIICQLVNVEEERIGKAQLPIAPPVGGSFPVRNPEIRLNLSVLFAGNPSEEGEGYKNVLELLSLVVQFFQGKHVFHTENSPDLSPELGQLIVELYPLSMENQNYLWGSLGVKYRPSVVYKVRLIKVLDDSMLDAVDAPRIIQQALGSK